MDTPLSVILSRIPTVVFRPFRRLIEWGVIKKMAVFDPLPDHGFPVGLITYGPFDAEIRSKIHQALDLFEEFAPHAYAQAPQRISRILIIERFPVFTYWTGSRTAAFGMDFVLSRSAIGLAMDLGYLVAQARIYDAGIPPWRDLAIRIDRLCTKAELVFAEQLPVERFPSARLYVAELHDRVATADRTSRMKRKPCWTVKIQE
jgi:hypothetical protein